MFRGNDLYFDPEFDLMDHVTHCFLKVEKILCHPPNNIKKFQTGNFCSFKTVSIQVWDILRNLVICKKTLLLYRNDIDHTMICIGCTFINIETHVQCALK